MKRSSRYVASHRFRRGVAVSWLVLTASIVTEGAALAHDPSAYGGLFRSRDFGGTWLNADVGLFLSGAVSIAVDPADPNHLLLGTDTGLLASRNGGRKWEQEAPAVLSGAVFAVLFLADGRSALCSTPAGIFQHEGGTWRATSTPSGAAPARAIARGATEGRLYLIGRRNLFRSEDSGTNWQQVPHNLPDEPEFTALAVAPHAPETVFAVIAGRVMASRDGGESWTLRSASLPEGVAEALSIDPSVPARLWVAIGSRVYRSDDGGAQWNPVGERLPEADTSVRAIAAHASGELIVVTTHRGIYRSTDAARAWGLVEGNLPVHLEAGPLVRDPTQPDTLYAGYALIPYGEIWRMALEGGNLLARVDPVSLAGGAAFLLLLGVLGVAVARRLARSPNTLRDSNR